MIVRFVGIDTIVDHHSLSFLYIMIMSERPTPIDPNLGNHTMYLTLTQILVAVIVLQLDLQLPMQLVHITTAIVSSNHDQTEEHNII